MKKFLCLLLSALMLLAAFPVAAAEGESGGAILANSVADGEYGLRTETIRNNYSIARKAAGEGMVLLENNGALPLADGEKITLFGVGQYNFVEGGTGSGANFTAYKPDLVDSMKAAQAQGRIVLNDALFDMYYTYYSQELADANIDQYHAQNQQAVNMDDVALTSEQVLAARAVSDTAIYTISRIQGEGSDRRAVKGDYYLGDIEAENLRLINEAGFKKFIVILNTSIAIDTSFIKDYADIDAVLLAWLPGTEGAYAITDILLGDVNPSGKLVDTFAKSYDDYPSAKTFLESNSYVNYSEDIFNGYRYFETFDPEYTKVNYEFGYGLSYTTFEISGDRVTNNETTVTVEATVKNTGSVAGKEVVQVYFSAPQGKLGKAARELAAYAKTELLEPGASQKLTMTFDIADMAAFDDLGKTGHKSAYVLEAGDYNIYVGNSVKNAGARGVKGTYKVSELTVTEQLTSLAAPKNLEKRLLADGTWESLLTAETGDDGSYKIDASAQKTIIEAENAQRCDDGITTKILFGGEQDNLKYLVGITSGKSAEYDVATDTAIPVILSIAVSNPGEAQTKPFAVYVNGTEIAVSAEIKNTCDAGKHVYAEFEYAFFNLAEGKNTIKLTGNTDSELELDYLIIRPAKLRMIGTEAETIIEAEDYDNISDGYDGKFEDATNGSKNLSSFNNGRWTEYLMYVPFAGDYDMIISYAANGAYTSPFVFSANGEKLTVASYTLPNTAPAGATGTTEIYNTVGRSGKLRIKLPAGVVTLRVTAPGSAPNFDALIIKPTGAVISPDRETRIEAEDFDNIIDDYDGNFENATNGSKNLSSFNNGKWTEYNLIVSEAGEYNLVLSYAAIAAYTSPFEFSANGEKLTVASYTLPKTTPAGATGTTEVYNTVKCSENIRIKLPAGAVTFRVTAPSGAPNFDAFIIKPMGVIISPDSVTRIEAEDYDNIIDDYNGNFEDATNGSKNLSSFGGKWTEYNLIVSEAGEYNLVLSYAATAVYTSPFAFSVNGEELTVGKYTLAKTSPADSTSADGAYWNTVAESDPLSVTLPRGKITLRITGASAAPNFDAFILSKVSDGSGEPEEPEDPDESDDPIDGDFSYAETDTPLSFIDVYNGSITMDEFLSSMRNIDLIKLAGGGPGTVSRSAASFGRLVEYEIPQVTVSDGGAGLRLEPDIGATCLPCSTLLACTWNTELIKEIGRVAGRDGMATNNDGWLAPGMNIHRNPLCGRNFEYFSEDPLVTGISASMVILGARNEGVNAVPKHFALNNKENGRGISDSRISERAMREIYLEGFRIMVKLTGHKYLMSSYNKVNGVEVAESYDLLTGILRNEWGFDGIVMTDWANDSNHLKEVKAGNNLKMPRGDINAFKDALADGTITRNDLKLNAKSVLNAILATNSMANAANFNSVSLDKSAVIHAKNFNFTCDNQTGQKADGSYVQAQSWAFLVNTYGKTDVYAPLTADISNGEVDYPDTRVFADYYIDALDAGKYTLDLLVCYSSGNGIVDVELDGEPLASVKVKPDKTKIVHTEPLALELTRGKHKIRLARNKASTCAKIKLNRVVVSPCFDTSLDGNASVNGKVIVVGSNEAESAYACNCSASIVLSENGKTKGIVREFDAAFVGLDNGNPILNYTISAPDGTYKLSIQKRGYTTVESEITVSGGFAMIPTLTLKRDDCTVYLPKCEECGRSAKAYEAHSFKHAYDKDCHYLECERCSVTDGAELAHAYDENGKCIICEYDSNAVYAVNVNFNEFGKVILNGKEYSESFSANVKTDSSITLTAVTNGDLPFMGWYAANGAKISDQKVLEFVVCEDISLEASFFPTYVLFTPDSGLSGKSSSDIIATKVEAQGGVPAHINYNVPESKQAGDGSRFYMIFDAAQYPIGYTSSAFPYVKICYRTKEYTDSLDINIENTAGARAWGAENFVMNNDGNFNTLIYNLSKKSDGTNNWSNGNENLNTTSPIFENNFTESPLCQFQIRAAGLQSSKLKVGNLDIAYVAFFSDLEEAEKFTPGGRSATLTLKVCEGGAANVGDVTVAGGTAYELEKFAKKDIVLTAVPCAGFQIDGWYNVTNGQNVLLSRELSYTYSFDENTEIELRFYDEAVSVLQKLVINPDEHNVGYVTIDGFEAIGDGGYYSSRKTVKLEAFVKGEKQNDYYPAYWHRLSDHVAFMGVGSELEAYPLGNKIWYEPVYGKIVDGQKQKIYLYIDHVHAVIAEKMSAESAPALPPRAGYEVEAWEKTTLGNEYVEVYMPTYRKSEFEGSSLKVNRQTVNASYDAKIIITAQNKDFKCFMISINGSEPEVLSYKNEYEYYNIIKGNVEIYESASYPAKVKENFINNVQTTVSDERINFIALHEVSDGYTLVERGVLMSKTKLDKNEFTIDNNSIIKGKIEATTEKATGVFTISKGSLSGEATWYGRAYMIVEKNDDKSIEVIYADGIAEGTYTPEA